MINSISSVLKVNIISILSIDLIVGIPKAVNFLAVSIKVHVQLFAIGLLRGMALLRRCKILSFFSIAILRIRVSSRLLRNCGSRLSNWLNEIITILICWLVLTDSNHRSGLSKVFLNVSSL